MKYYPCYDDLLGHLLTFMQMPERFKNLLFQHLTEPITYNEDTSVLKPDQVARMAYWQVKGYLRSYKEFKPEADREMLKQKTIDISLPRKIWLPAKSFMIESEVDYHLEITKGSTMVGFSHDAFMEMGKQMPEVFMLANKIIGAAETDWHMKMEMCRVFNREGYATFLDHFGLEVEHFIEQQHIASYIGMRPEELSRIKRKKMIFSK
jgi:hypothetical protein